MLLSCGSGVARVTADVLPSWYSPTPPNRAAGRLAFCIGTDSFLRFGSRFVKVKRRECRPDSGTHGVAERPGGGRR